MKHRIAIIYGTTEGQTEKIADHMVDLFRQQGVEATPYNIKELPGDFSPTGYDGLIVGGSVHAGNYPKKIARRAREWAPDLAEMPSAFYSVSLTESHDTEEARREVSELVDTFLEETRWRPALVASFAGALKFSRYGFFKRKLMKNIAERATGEAVDPRRDYEYTDWTSVDQFVEEFIRHLEGRGAQDLGAERRPSAL